MSWHFDHPTNRYPLFYELSPSSTREHMILHRSLLLSELAARESTNSLRHPAGESQHCPPLPVTHQPLVRHAGN